jgi:hypothetical protein
MPPRQPRTIVRTRIRRLRVAGLLAAGVALAVALGSGAPWPSSSTASAPVPADRSTAPPPARTASPAAGAAATPAPPAGAPRGEGRGRLGLDDGAVPDGTTVFDDDIPGVGRLDPALLEALRRAARDASSAGVELVVDSGWRSPDYQRHLLREAVARYGSEREAARWVATAETSAHVSGDAVDIGPRSAADWLGEHGAAYGLCRVYANEPWHFELRPGAAGGGCPAPYPDPTHDPRMGRR